MPVESLLFYCFPDTTKTRTRRVFAIAGRHSAAMRFSHHPTLPVYLHLNGTFCHTCHDILLQENIKNDNRDDRYQHSREDQLPRVTVLT